MGSIPQYVGTVLLKWLVMPAFLFGFCLTNYIPIKENGQPPYYMGAHFINDTAWECKPSHVKNLERSNNRYWDGFPIKAKNIIIIGEEIFLGYDDTQYAPKEKNYTDNNY